MSRFQWKFSLLLKPPRDYVPVAETPFHPTSVVSLKGKVVVALVGAFMAWNWIPRIFAAGTPLVDILLNILYSVFFVFMFSYSAYNAYKDIRDHFKQKSAGAKESKNVKAVSDSNRSA